MPFLNDDEAASSDLMRFSGGFDLPEPAPAPKPMDVVSAAFHQDNEIVSATDYLLQERNFKPEEGYDPYDDQNIKGSKYLVEYGREFIGSRSSGESNSIRAGIDARLERQRLLASSGAWGTAAGVAAGILSPTTFLPGGAAFRAGRLGERVARSALSVGMAAGAATAVQEGVLQATQEGRPLDQSLASIATSTVLGGILGGAIGGLAKHEVAAMEKGIEDMAAYQPGDARIFTPVSGGSAAVEPKAPLNLAGAGGAEIAAAKLSPVTALQTSPFDASKAAVRDLADAGLTYEQNFAGIPTSVGGTVETRVKMWQAPLAQSFEDLDSAFAKYWSGKAAPGFSDSFALPLRSEVASMTGNAGEKMTFAEFKEQVSAAMIRGDAHAVPEVAEAARSFRQKVFDPLKMAAIKTAQLPEGISVDTAMSYLTRVYNRDKIIAQRNEWMNTLENHLKAERASSRNSEELSRMSDAEIRALAQEVTNNILSESAFRVPGLSIVQGARGPLKERTLRVPDAIIEPFLERDIEKVARVYTRTMSADVELAAKFGRVDMQDQLTRLLDEFNDRVAAAGSDAERVSLTKRYEFDRSRIEAIRDRIRNTYALPDNPDGLSYRLAKTAMSLNFVSKLGNMTVAALSDPARAVFKYGLMTAFKDGWLPYITNLKTAKLSAREVRLAGTALDMVLDTRSHALNDIMDDFGSKSKFERAVEGLSSKMGLLSAMAPWNAAQKQIVGTIAISEILRASKAIAGGSASRKQVGNLAAGGIDDQMARRIWAQFDGDETAKGAGSIKDGIYLPNTENWKDVEAVDAFRAAVVREVDNSIVTPGLEKPLWMSTTLGKVVGQFKSFAFSSTQRTLISGLQQRDAAALQGAVMMLALGALSRKLTADIKGDDTTDWNGAKWAVEAVDASGLLGILMEGNNLSEKLTRGRVGLSAITGKEVSRYQSRNAAGALLGPTFGFATDAMSVVGNASAADWSASDTRAVRQLVPFQNLFWLRRGFDQIEAGVNSSLGVPERKKPH